MSRNGCHPANLTVGLEDAHGEAATRLIAELCADLSERYQRPPSPFSPEEASKPRTAMVVARRDGKPVGCGELRQMDDETAEVKRMYVVPGARRGGVARAMLDELERYAGKFGYRRVILETGVFQPEAIALYVTTGYVRTEPYGRYVDNPEAVCFEKCLPKL